MVLDVDAPDEATARSDTRAMCERLLANPVTEDFEIASVSAA
jgi:phosphoribosylformylglycinamidine synthase